MKVELDIIREDREWDSSSEISDELISTICRASLEDFPYFKNCTVNIAILLTGDGSMQKLNAKFRGKDKPTNILSFPDCEINRKDLLEKTLDKDYIYIGDIACSHQTILGESREAGLGMLAHLAHILVHGILHLVGYDHERNDLEAEEMMHKEIEILQKLSIKSPY